jgi:hypothetical protein
MIVYKKSTGPKWHSFFYDGSRGSRYVQVTTDLAVDVYGSVGANSNPTEFDYGFVMKGMTGTFLLQSSELRPYLSDESGFTLNFFVSGYDQVNNSALENTMKVWFID